MRIREGEGRMWWCDGGWYRRFEMSGGRSDGTWGGVGTKEMGLGRDGIQI